MLCWGVMSRLPDGSSRRGVLCKHCKYPRAWAEIIEGCEKLGETFVFPGEKLGKAHLWAY